MKKKHMRRSVLCFLLVLIQVFFAFSLTALAADEEPKGVVASLSATTLEQDLTAAKVAEKDALYIEGQSAVSLVAFSAEKASATSFDLFFYLFSPKGFDDLKSAKVALSEDAEGATTRSVVGDILDRSKTLLKLRVSGAARKLVGYNETSQTLSIKLHSYDLTYKTGTVSYSASYSDFIGSESNGFYTFSYDLTSGILQSSNQIDTLEMQVTLAAERFWKSEHTYTQVNTAMMLLPDSFFLRYGEIEWIEYMYALYEKVPMLVTTSKDLYNKYVLQNTRVPLGNMVAAGEPGAVGDTFQDIELDYLHYDHHFAFLVNSIAENEDIIERDVGAGEILKRFYLAKDFYGHEALSTMIYSSSVSEKHPFRVGKDEIFEKEHSEPNIWDRIFGGGLLDHYEDNSFLLEKIHVVESVDLSLSDEQLSDLYAIAEYYVPSFRSLALDCKKGYRLVLMRYLTTDYIVEDFTHYGDPDKSKDYFTVGVSGKGYLCLNSIVEDFQILKIQFAKEDAVGNVVRTTIFPDNPEQDFVDSPESDAKGEDEAKITPDEWWQKILEYLKSIGETIRKACLAIVICIGVVLVLRFVALLRDAFGRRYPKEDRPRRRR